MAKFRVFFYAQPHRYCFKDLTAEQIDPGYFVGPGKMFIGGLVSDTDVYSGDTLTLPTMPALPGCDFVGWGKGNISDKNNPDRGTYMQIDSTGGSITVPESASGDWGGIYHMTGTYTDSQGNEYPSVVFQAVYAPIGCTINYVIDNQVVDTQYYHLGDLYDSDYNPTGYDVSWEYPSTYDTSVDTSVYGTQTVHTHTLTVCTTDAPYRDISSTYQVAYDTSLYDYVMDIQGFADVVNASYGPACDASLVGAEGRMPDENHTVTLEFSYDPLELTVEHYLNDVLYESSTYETHYMEQIAGNYSGRDKVKPLSDASLMALHMKLHDVSSTYIPPFDASDYYAFEDSAQSFLKMRMPSHDQTVALKYTGVDTSVVFYVETNDPSVTYEYETTRPYNSLISANLPSVSDFEGISPDASIQTVDTSTSRVTESGQRILYGQARIQREVRFVFEQNESILCAPVAHYFPGETIVLPEYSTPNPAPDYLYQMIFMDWVLPESVDASTLEMPDENVKIVAHYSYRHQVDFSVDPSISDWTYTRYVFPGEIVVDANGMADIGTPPYIAGYDYAGVKSHNLTVDGSVLRMPEADASVVLNYEQYPITVHYSIYGNSAIISEISTKTLSRDDVLGQFPTLPEVPSGVEYDTWGQLRGGTSLYPVTESTTIQSLLDIYDIEVRDIYIAIRKLADVTFQYLDEDGIVTSTQTISTFINAPGEYNTLINGDISVDYRQTPGFWTSIVTLPPTITRSENEFNKFCVQGPGTINVEYERAYFELTLIDQDTEEVVFKSNILPNSPIAEYAPQRTGYICRIASGTLENMPKYDYTAYVFYAVDENSRTITFKAFDTIISSRRIYPGEVITIPSYDAPEGYKFNGWLGLPSGNIMPDADLVVTANLIDKASLQRTVSYYVNGELYRAVKYLPGDTVVAETAPSLTGYRFIGWTPVVTMMPDFDVRIDAQYIEVVQNNYTITWMIGSKIIDITNLPEGSAVTAPSAPSRPGYTFQWNYWPSQMPAVNLTVYGTYTEIAKNEYGVHYYLDGNYVSTTWVLEGESVPKNTNPSVPAGYKFNSWEGEPDIMPAEDVYVYGTTSRITEQSNSEFSVILKVDGRIIRSTIYPAGAYVSLQNAPQKEGYTFAGWDHESTFTMPDSDVTINGYYTRVISGAKHEINYYAEGQQTRSKKLKASNTAYTVQETQEYFTGEKINAAKGADTSTKTFVGWNGLPSRMGTENVDVYAVYSQTMPTGLTEVSEDNLPIIREKLVNASTGSVRKGNVLPLSYAEPEDYNLEDGTAIRIRRIVVTLPGGTTQTTNYYVRSSISPSGTRTGESADIVIKIDNEFYDATLSESGVNVLQKSESQETPEDDYYILSDRVEVENQKYYEMIRLASDEKTFIRGSELFVSKIHRPSYGTFDEGHPTLLTDSEGSFTNWVRRIDLYNNHHAEFAYYETLTRDLLSKITVSVQNELTVSDYEPEPDEILYKYLWYPKGDIALVQKSRIEYIAQSEQNATAAVLSGDHLTIFKVQRTDASEFGVIYLTADDERISMLTGRKGEAIIWPDTIERRGYIFKGYADDKPLVYPDSPVSVATLWEKDESFVDDTSSDTEVKRYKLTHIVPNKNWKYYSLLEEGETIPAHPDPDISGITITAWKLTSAYFEGDTMPAFDVTYEAIYTEGESAEKQYLLKWNVIYNNQNGKQIQEVIAQYAMTEGTPITPETAPYKRGGTWLGWEDFPGYMPSEDLTIDGYYSGTVMDTYPLNYFVNGEIYKTVSYAPGDTITPEADPVREGYVFTGWIGLPDVMPAYEVNVNGMLYGSEEADGLVSVKYKVDGADYKSYRMMPGNELPKEPYPTKTGYTFSGWTPVYTTVPEYDVVISGTFRSNTEVADKYRLQFFLNDILYSKVILPEGSPIVAPTVTIEGFTGWVDCPEVMPGYDLDIYGTVESDNTYTITYLLDGETYKTVSDMKPGDVITVEPDPEVPEGKYFSGWSGIPSDKRMPAYNLTVRGYFTDSQVTGTYRILFKDRNAVLLNAQLEAGATITPPEDPTRSGYKFGGWQNLPNDLKMPAYNLTCSAIWTSDDGKVLGTYKVIKVESDGSSTERYYGEQRYTPGDTIVYMEDPAAISGYTWKGWQSSLVVNDTVPDTDFEVIGTFIASGVTPSLEEYQIKWIVTFQGNDYIVREDKAQAGALIFSPADPMKLLREVHGLDTYGYVFDKWDEFDRYARRDQEIHGTTKELDGEYFNVYIKYLYKEADGSEREVAVRTEQQMGGQPFIMPEEPEAQEGYIWKGWSREVSTYSIQGVMPFRDETVTGTWVAEESDNGYIAGYFRVQWILPNYDTNALNHNPYNVWKTQYVPVGQTFSEPEDTPEEWLGLDGFTYQFVRWEDHENTANDYRVILKIKAVAQRKSVNYNVIYKIQWYESATNISDLITYDTVSTPAGTTIQFITPEETEGWIWNGKWEAVGVEYYNPDGTYTMPWRDITFRSKMYSKEYAEQANPSIEGYHWLIWASHTYDSVGNLVTNHDWIIHKELKKAGTAITDRSVDGLTMEGSVIAGYGKRSYVATGWESHPATMPDNDLYIYATWSVNELQCLVTWMLNVYDANGNVTVETYYQSNQTQSSWLVYPDDPVREGYIFAGWDDGRISNLNIVVPNESTKTIYGDLVSVEYGGYGHISGYNRVVWRLPNYNPNQLDHNPYDEWMTEYVKFGADITEPDPAPTEWTGMDGFVYVFDRWEPHISTMYSYSKELVINAMAHRKPVAYTCTYYLHKYPWGSADYWEIYTTRDVNADSEIPMIEVDEPDGWRWNRKWVPYSAMNNHRPNTYQMPWADYNMESKLYSEEYILNMHPTDIDAYVLNWASRSWSSDGWREKVGEVYKSEVLFAGDPIVEPEDIDYDNLVAPAPSYWPVEYTFGGWDTHPNVMPAKNLDIFCIWDEQIQYCEVVWTLRVYDESGSVTEEVFARTKHIYGKYLTYPSTEPSRTDYYFTGWEDGHVSNVMPLVPRQPQWIIYGNLKSVYFIDGYQPGMTLVNWRLPNYDTNQLNHDPYDVWKSRYIAHGEYIANPSQTPANWTGLDGYEYQFLYWKAHATTSTASELNIDAAAKRVPKQYNVTYYGRFYYPGNSANYTNVKLWTDSVWAGTDYMRRTINWAGWVTEGNTWSSDDIIYVNQDRSITMPWKDLDFYRYYRAENSSSRIPEGGGTGSTEPEEEDPTVVNDDKYIVRYWCGPTTAGWQSNTTTNRTKLGEQSFKDGALITSLSSAESAANKWANENGYSGKVFKEWIYYEGQTATALGSKRAAYLSSGNTAYLNVFATWQDKADTFVKVTFQLKTWKNPGTASITTLKSESVEAGTLMSRPEVTIPEGYVLAKTWPDTIQPLYDRTYTAELVKLNYGRWTLSSGVNCPNVTNSAYDSYNYCKYIISHGDNKYNVFYVAYGDNLPEINHIDKSGYIFEGFFTNTNTEYVAGNTSTVSGGSVTYTARYHQKTQWNFTVKGRLYDYYGNLESTEDVITWSQSSGTVFAYPSRTSANFYDVYFTDFLFKKSDGSVFNGTTLQDTQNSKENLTLYLDYTEGRTRFTIKLRVTSITTSYWNAVKEGLTDDKIKWNASEGMYGMSEVVSDKWQLQLYRDQTFTDDMLPELSTVASAADYGEIQWYYWNKAFYYEMWRNWTLDKKTTVYLNLFVAGPNPNATPTYNKVTLDFYIEDFTGYFEERGIGYPRNYESGVYDYEPTLIPVNKTISGYSSGLVLKKSDIPSWSQIGSILKSIYGTDDISKYHLGSIQWTDRPMYPISSPTFYVRYDSSGKMVSDYNSWTFTSSKKIVLANLWFLGNE